MLLIRYLAAGKKDASRDRMQYKWMVYVQGASKEERDISHFVDKVVFMLDESYRPNDIITITYVFSCSIFALIVPYLHHVLQS
jgi:YEATS family